MLGPPKCEGNDACRGPEDHAHRHHRLAFTPVALHPMQPQRILRFLSLGANSHKFLSTAVLKRPVFLAFKSRPFFALVCHPQFVQALVW